MLTIPSKFEAILKKDPYIHGQVITTVAVFSKIFEDNKLYFFPEYTDHGVKHINSVLNASEHIITNDTFDKILNPNNVAILVLSIILHDLGMQLTFDSFKSLVDGKNDDIKDNILDEKTWNQLWEDYLDEAKKFSGKQLKAIFGNEHHIFRRPDLNDRLNITEADKLLIGEFIRRNHPRIAQEISLKGLVGKNNELLEFASGTDKWIRQLAGIVARSHGMEIRDTFEYLKTISEEEWSKPYSVDVIFLMVVLRIADYFQFDATRIDKPLLKLKTFSSPISQIEHDKHLAIDFVKPYTQDPEVLYIEAKPDNSNLFLKLSQLFKSIQYELDISWAILGEIYGKESQDKQPKIQYRRVKSNLDKRGQFLKNVTYIPEKINFEYDNDLAKLLIAPLYGNDPTYGVRELLQNAIDACKELEAEYTKLSKPYEALIKVSIIEEDNVSFFIIEDNGKGMTLAELKNYFLKAGSSFRKSIDWQKKYTNEDGKSDVMRSGRFGVGVLAAFLLGDEIEVETYNSDDYYTYSFKAKLDSEQLNIEKKTPRENRGTKIKILLELDKKEKLKNIDRWQNWYRFKKPKVIYQKNNKNVVTSNLIDPLKVSDEQHEIFPEHFDKVIWYYSKNNITTCNGILVPNTYILKYINSTPTIHIIDSNAKLDLNLSRQSIMGKLSFEDELLEDIFKDFIASMLLYKNKYLIKDNKLQISSSTESFNHPSGIKMDSYFYTTKGFIINYNYFTQSYEGNKKKIHIGFNSSADPSEEILLDFKSIPLDNYLIDFNLSVSINNYSNYLQYIGEKITSYLQFYRPTRIYHSQKLYDLMFENNKVHHTVEKSHKINEQKYGWISWDYDNIDTSDLNLEIFKEDLKKISFITEEIYFNSSHNYFNNVLNKLLKMYIGENYIIPYDIEERKKMYGRAFDELEPYMRKYLK
ncbi:HD domain-containing protein [Flectobacillus roseus]|uniref:HD domain-containing protein n=1 Tax=Flectobacillus roseus TaxID=502259 RepID=UPI0024B70504|nr:ATP-binding protein [Flectobacillus roseus]MDI9869004.1 ATP-binding protein [Flectobacillus roseus]